jgi:hypothetical protein
MHAQDKNSREKATQRMRGGKLRNIKEGKDGRKKVRK